MPVDSAANGSNVSAMIQFASTIMVPFTRSTSQSQISRRYRYRTALALTALIAAISPKLANAQSEPFAVYDTKPVILHGPYVVAPTETSAMIVWGTDTPCHSKVLYGADNLNQEATNEKDGLLPVSTLHAVRLSGLRAGRTYEYKVVSTRVVRLKAYWPDKGLSTESGVYSFKTFDAGKPTTSFSVITDTHEDVPRIDALMKSIDWNTTDFLVHTGDAFNSVESDDQAFTKWLDPVAKGLGHSKPLVYARGNHDTRGAYARDLFAYVPNEEGRYYYARDNGPVHLVAIDTGEDKGDRTNVYSGLNGFAAYRDREFAWFQEHARSDKRMEDAPFRVVVMHQPGWGWVNGENAKWTTLANDAKIDLVIAGHNHRFSRIRPGQKGNNYEILVVGQDQVARVDASAAELNVVVTGKNGAVVDSFTLPRRAVK
jgi:acid phosphatase type 7